MGVDSVGVDEGELGEGLFPAGGGLAFDEVSFGFAFGAAAKTGDVVFGRRLAKKVATAHSRGRCGRVSNVGRGRELGGLVDGR